MQIKYFEEFKIPDWPRVSRVIDFITKHIKSGRVLDIGYSEGSFADYLNKKGWDCIGIDVNIRKSKSVKLVCGDLNRNIPFKSSSFDLITAGEVMEHLFDDVYFLKECNRILKSDSYLILTIPNIAYSLNRLLVLFGKLPKFFWAPYHCHFYNLKYITQLLRENGFKVIKISSSHILYSRRRHFSGRIFEILAEYLPAFGAHLIIYATKDK